MMYVCRALFRDELYPPNTRIVGYARSKLTIDQIKEKCKPYLKVQTTYKMFIPPILIVTIISLIIINF